MDGVPGEAQTSRFAATDGGTAGTLEWLLDGAPSIRWQVLADLTDAGQVADPLGRADNERSI